MIAAPTAVLPTALPPTATPLALTLEQKVGLLLLAGINGASLDSQTRALITRWQVGGIVLRGRNVRDGDQVRALALDLQAAARDAGSGPLFIAADQEGGDVTRLAQGLTRFPSAMALGASGDAGLAYRVGYAAAAELLAAGVNVNLAPVLDSLTNPDNLLIGTRAFGSDPALIGRLGAAFVRGTLAAGAIPVLKHYPGHGGTATDSHAGLPAAAALDTAPFDAVLARSDAPVVMVGHVWAQPLDPAPRPASLSSAVIGRLRNGFDGVILTDSLNMGAVANQHPAAEAALLAFQAGADWLIIAEPADVPAAAQALLAAAQTGAISAERLDESVRRLLSLRAQVAAGPPEPGPDPAASQVLAQEVARRGLALACPAGNACSARIAPGAQRLLLIAPSHLPAADPGTAQVTYLAQRLAARGLRVVEWLYSVESPPRGAEFASQAELYARASDVVVFGAWDAEQRNTALQAEVLRRVQAAGRPVIVLGLHTPFDQRALPMAGAYLATFGDTREQMEAAAGALAGEFEPTGQLPGLDP